MLLRDAIDGYVLSQKAARASKNTLRVYGFMLDRVAAFAAKHGRTRLDELTLDIARGAIIEAMHPPDGAEASNWKGGEATAYMMGCALKSFSAVLRAERVAVTDFSVLRIKRPPERIQPRIRPDEFRALEAAVLRRLMGSRVPRLLVARDLALLSFMADTGLRAAEISRLNVEDLDLQAGTIGVWGKGDKPRVLPIYDASERDGGATLRVLRDYLAACDQTFGPHRRQRALWLTRRGNRLSPDALRDDLAKLCDEAGIDGNRPPHAFRRGYFSEEYRSRPTALPVVSARMGWSPRSHHMVDVYTRGAEIDLVMEQPQPSVARRWRDGPSPRRGGGAFSYRDVGPPPWAELDDAPPPRRAREDGERAGGQPTRGRRTHTTRSERA